MPSCKSPALVHSWRAFSCVGRLTAMVNDRRVALLTRTAICCSVVSRVLMAYFNVAKVHRPYRRAHIRLSDRNGAFVCRLVCDSWRNRRDVAIRLGGADRDDACCRDGEADRFAKSPLTRFGVSLPKCATSCGNLPRRTSPTRATRPRSRPDDHKESRSKNALWWRSSRRLAISC
jgi:hypothetical protein